MGTEEIGRYGAAAGRDGEVGVLCFNFFFKEVQHVYSAKLMLTVSRNGNPIINDIKR